MKLERDTFGPVLRAARERKGVTLRQLAIETKLSVELWEGLEENDLSRWPKRIFARSYVRDYAVRVGLEPDDVVNEFCRLFPEWGDRRAERLIREKAAIVDHDLRWQDLPTPHARRAGDQGSSPATRITRHGPRVLAAALDAGAVLGLGALGGTFGIGFWPAAAVGGMLYTASATLLGARTAGAAAANGAFRLARAFPAHRRLTSSKTQNA